MVSLRARHPRLYLAALAVGAVLAVGMLVNASAASAQQQSATFNATDNVWDWTGGNGTTASIFTGGTVFFANGGNNPHNLFFTGPSQPSSCTQTTGPANPPPILPMPGPPTTQDWTGNCTFNSPGTFSFLCQQHSGMTGTVQVVNPPPGGGNPPPPPPGGSPPPGGGGSGGGGGGTGGTDPGGSPTQPGSTSIKFTRKQTGTTLRGSVTAAAGAKIVVTALVSNRSLSTSRPKKIKKVKVGSQTKRSTGARINFAVKLNAAAKRALKRKNKLSVTLRIVVTPSGGKATTKTVVVTLRED
jgi:plastocyanin